MFQLHRSNGRHRKDVEEIVTNFEAISQYLPGGTEENHEKLQSE
jgi:hypothetical protein